MLKKNIADVNPVLQSWKANISPAVRASATQFDVAIIES